MEQHPAPWNSFGSRLRLARMAAGISQAELSQRLGKIGNSWLSSLEAGRWRMPANLEEVATLARAVKVAPEWLLFARNFKTAKLVALGIGGDDVALPGKEDGSDRFALWPKAWRRRAGCRIPNRDALLICTTALQPGHDVVAWWDRELVVASADVDALRDDAGALLGYVATLTDGSEVQPLARVLSERMPRR